MYNFVMFFFFLSCTSSHWSPEFMYKVWFRYVTKFLRYGRLPVLATTPPISFGCDGQTLPKIKNPSSNLCEAWSKDHVRPVSWSSDQICDLWNFSFAFCSIHYGGRTTWTCDVIFASNLHRYWPNVLKLERCLCLKGPRRRSWPKFFSRE